MVYNFYQYSDWKVLVTIEVCKEDEIGNLIPTVTAAESSVAITADTENSSQVTVDNLKFTNGYLAKPTTFTPEAKKIYETDGEMKAFDFVLFVDGVKKPTKQNDTEGNIFFDTLDFAAAGTYELKIHEQQNILWGLIRWDRNVYTVILHVEDNGAGQLVVNESKTQITSSNGRVDLVFRNADHNVIVDKDVFLADSTTSIDGMTVEKNDILVYQISYHNVAGAPVDITITDINRMEEAG